MSPLQQLALTLSSCWRTQTVYATARREEANTEAAVVAYTLSASVNFVSFDMPIMATASC